MSTPAIYAKPSEIGLDASRLHRIDDHFRHYVDNGQLAGWLIAVMRHGELAHFLPTVTAIKKQTSQSQPTLFGASTR